MLQHKFVDFIPKKIEQNTIYVSIENEVVVHNCICGCGEEVVTPLAPTEWKLIFDGKTITLHPSIGNWSFACRSHYWIKQNRVQWAENWTHSEIELNRRHDKDLKMKYYNQPHKVEKPFDNELKPRFWQKISRHFSKFI